MLSQTHKEHYREKGWTVVEGIFESAHAQRIAELALSFGEESAHLGYDVDASDDGRRAPRKIDKPFEKDERFRAFVLNERLRDVIRELLGGEPLLIADQIFLKPPHFGSAKPYHQDNAYFRRPTEYSQRGSRLTTRTKPTAACATLTDRIAARFCRTNRFPVRGTTSRRRMN